MILYPSAAALSSPSVRLSSSDPPVPVPSLSCPHRAAHPFLSRAVSLSCRAAPALQCHHCSSSVPSPAQGSVRSPRHTQHLTCPLLLPSAPHLCPPPFPELSSGAEVVPIAGIPPAPAGSQPLLLPILSPSSPSTPGALPSPPTSPHARRALRLWSDNPASSSHWHLLQLSPAPAGASQALWDGSSARFCSSSPPCCANCHVHCVLLTAHNSISFSSPACPFLNLKIAHLLSSFISAQSILFSQSLPY